MREDFERLPEIVQGLRHCHYDESTNIYHADAAHVEEFEWHTQFVNGAWYAFQEQQKKIDEIVGIVREADLSNGDSSVAIVHDEIQELLK